jgi:hypothetical protein
VWDLQTLNRLNAEAEQRARELLKRRIAWEAITGETQYPNPDAQDENPPRYPEGDISEWRDPELKLAIDRTIADLEALC